MRCTTTLHRRFNSAHRQRVSVVVERLSRQSKTRLSLWGILFVALLGSIDYLTGIEISFSIFYLLPVSAVAWTAGRQAGVILSAASAVTWLAADLTAGHVYSHPVIPFWNALVRCCLFLIVSFTLSSLHKSIQNRERLTRFIVHDLKSPLTVMLAGYQLLEDHTPDAADETWRRIVNHGVASGQQMLRMINSLLDAPRLKSGEMPVQIEMHPARVLVDESLAQIELLARQKRITVEARAVQDAVVQADRELTTRVLGNLLSNAVKFSPAGSSVRVDAEAVDGAMLELRVNDQGGGIADEWVERIFDEYVQVRADGGGARLGSGLGLYFCRLAVEAQGGRIWLDGTEEKGTTMTFTLPLASPNLE
jgi:signal transduction histidine kinase